MTSGLLISLYLFTLAAFLGLDVVRKVPPTLYGALAAGMGAAAAIVLVLTLFAAGALAAGPLPVGTVGSLVTVAVIAATAGVTGGLVRLWRLLQKRGGGR